MTVLSKTVALVSGGSSGLGAAAALKLVQAGARVLVADLDEESFRRLVHDQSLLKSQILFRRVDVTSDSEVSAALDQVEREFGEPVNAAISCAGIAIARKTLSSKGVHPMTDFQTALSVNTVGTFNVARLSAERISQRDVMENGLRGCIINTASIAAYEGQKGQVAYAASKGAVVGMTLPMARDLSEYKIRVVTVVGLLCFPFLWPVKFFLMPMYQQAPGLFETPLLSSLPIAVKAELGASVPCPSRLGKPAEYGELICSIISNDMLNGCVIRLDGGLRMPP